MMGIAQKLAHLYGLPEHGQTDISTLLRVRCESLIPELIRGRSAGLKSTFRPGA
jgi:hypothetical protein